MIVQFGSMSTLEFYRTCRHKEELLIWVLQNYSHYSSVTSTQQELNWSKLQQKTRLVLYYKAMQNINIIQL